MADRLVVFFRYLISIFIAKYWSSAFPMATFITNILGCFLIGFIFGFLDKNNIYNPDVKLILLTGFCGGFTTFSAFGYENYSLIYNQNYFVTALYISGTIFLGILSVGLGLFMNKLV